MLKKELHRFKVDPYLDEWSISPDGGRISYIGSPIRTDEQEETICVRNIKTDTDALLHGKHFNMPKDFNGFRTMSIGPVFYDGILHDGKRYLLLSRSGGCWNHATVFLFDWKKKDPVLLKGGLMTANFARNRFAVCTRDNRLDIYDLDGKSFHAVERLPGERTACMSFAPDGKTLLIGDDKGKIRRVTLPK